MENEFMNLEFEAQKKLLHETSARLERGEAKTYTIEEARVILEETIRKYEVKKM